MQLTKNAVDNAIIDLLTKEPFFYHIFSNLDRIDNRELPAIAAVTLEGLTRYALHYNPTFDTKIKLDNGRVLQFTNTDFLCILKHEICHIINKHLINDRFKSNSVIWNYATDCAINQMIDGWSNAAKEICVFPKTLKKMLEKHCTAVGNPQTIDVKEKMDAIYYYDLIMKYAPNTGQGKNRNGKGTNGKGKGSGPAGQGDKDGSEPDTKSLDDYINDSHRNWESLTDEQKDFVEENLKRMVLDAAEKCQNAGCDLGKYEDLINGFRKTKTLNWKQIIRRFASYDVSDLDYTFKRPDRRNRNMFPGKRRLETVDFIWGTDTSGSVSDDDFVRVLNEMQKIGRQFNKDKVRHIQVDAGIANDSITSLRKMKKLKFYGRGGTDMLPLFNMLRKEKNRKPVILFTDGYFFNNVNTDAYPFKILFLLTENGTDQYIKGKNYRIARVLPENDLSLCEISCPECPTSTIRI